MTSAADGVNLRRMRLHLQSRRSLTDDLGLFGRMVGPRRGSRGRTHGEKENYCLRRWLLAMTAADRLPYPITVISGDPDLHEPDFLLRRNGADGAIGLEVTEAGEATWQSWLARSETRPGPSFPMDSEDGYAGDRPERIVIRDVRDAIRRKVAKRRQGAYAATPNCDLLVYENSEGGLLCDRMEVIRGLTDGPRQLSEPGGSFDRVHLLFGDQVYLDLLGNERLSIDVAELHADDWSAWLLRQAAHLRQRNLGSIDFDNLAEELESLGRSDQRALRSHLLILLLHLLKWDNQPNKRGSSWQNSILSAREEVEELLAENPGFENKLLEFVANQYPKAATAAAKEMGVDASSLPIACPYTIDQLRDRDFWPGTAGP